MLATVEPGSARDRIRGCLIGAVLGDAFGAPLEGASRADVGTLVARRVAARAPWRYTDDGAMVLACARALVTTTTIEPVRLLRQMASQYDPVRGFGRGMKMALAAFDAGTAWDRCAFVAWPEGSRGNGGAVRIPAVAVARWETLSAFQDAIQLSTRVTHAHPEALASAQLHAAAVALVLREPVLVQRPAAFHAALLESLALMPDVVADKLRVVFELVAQGANAERAAKALGTSMLAVESVPVALWSFMTRHATFADAVASAALLGGDVDSICSLVGALVGALHGLSGIDAIWLENLAQERPTLNAMVDLADAIHVLTPRSPCAT